MGERKRVLFLILIMTIAALVTGGISITLLYQTAFREEQVRLVETAQSQARLMEAVARFDTLYSQDYPKGATAATLSQIRDAHQSYAGFGETGEFTLAQREGDSIVFLLRHRHFDLDQPQPVSFASELAEPMRRALSGQSETMVGLDYRGEIVLAAYEPVAELDMGIVAKIDLAEIQAPFIRAGLTAGAVTVMTVLLGALLFIQVTNPLLKDLQQNQERLNAFMNAATESFGIYDSELNLIEINKTGLGWWPVGTKKKDLIGKNILELAPSLKGTERYEMYVGVIKTGKSLYSTDVIPDSKFGDVHLEVRAFKVGNGLGLITIDITERKQMEETLQESEAKYRTLFESSPVSITIIGVDGVVLECNDVALKISGLARHEIVGRSFLETSGGQEKELPGYVDLFSRAVKGEDIDFHKLKITRPNNETRWIEASAVALKKNDEVYALQIITHDITEQMQADEQIKAALEEKVVLVREIHHRVKNNLTVLIYLIDMQAETIENTEVLQALADLQGRARAMAIVHEKLYQATDMSQVDFGDYLYDLTSQLIYAYKDKRNIALRVEAANILVNINIAIPCGLIVNELVTNALKYAFPSGPPRGGEEKEGGQAGKEKEGHPTGGEEIRVAFELQNGEYLLKVSDNGIGLPPEMNWRTTESLGLKLVNIWATRQLAGSLKVDTRSGTAFTIRFRERK